VGTAIRPAVAVPYFSPEVVVAVAGRPAVEVVSVDLAAAGD